MYYHYLPLLLCHYSNNSQHNSALKAKQAHGLGTIRMREIGIRPVVVERIIGHYVDSGIIGVYSSYNWFPEMKMVLIKWKDWINGDYGITPFCLIACFIENNQNISVSNLYI